MLRWSLGGTWFQACFVTDSTGVAERKPSCRLLVQSVLALQLSNDGGRDQHMPGSAEALTAVVSQQGSEWVVDSVVHFGLRSRLWT